MSLEDQINYLTAAVQSLETVVSTLTTAMVTLTMTAVTEIESKTKKPMIEVITKENLGYENMMQTLGFETGQRKPRAKEQFPRAICKSSCCGAEHHRYSPKRDGCGACKP